MSDESKKEPDSTQEASSEAPGSTASETGIRLTPEELQQTIQQAVTAAMASMPRPEPNPPRQEPSPPPSEDIDFFAGLRDDDILEVGKARALLKNQEQRFGPIVQGMRTLYEGQVGQFETNSRLLHPDLWKQYGDEIRREIEKTKQTQIVTAETYENAIAVVKGRHIDEFVEARAKQLLEQAPPGDVAGGGEAGLPRGIDQGPQIPDSWKELMKEYGIGIQQIDDMVRMRREWGETNFTREDYFKEMANHQIIRDGRNKLVADDLTEKKNG